MAFAAPSLKGRALRYLAQREHSRAELERKLARFAEATPDETAAQRIARALDELQAAGLLNEARVAESVLAHAAPRFGARRLRQTLQAKGLAPELVAQTLRQARDSEVDRAREVWRKRFGTPPVDVAARAKQMRFLAGRGFDGDVIRRVVPRAGEGGEDDPEG